LSSKKILIMASRSQSPEGVPPGSQEPFGPGPYSAGQIHILDLLTKIEARLGATWHATRNLEDTSRIHDERILQLIERTTKAETTLADAKETVGRNTRDLDGLGARHSKDLGELKKDVNEVGRRIERDLNEMGRRLDREISDLRNVAHTAVSFGKLGLALLAGGVLAELIRHFFSK
jgi:hypothetical protein